MSSSNDNGVSSSNNNNFTSTSSDEDILEDMDENDFAFFQMMAKITSNSNEFFLSHEI
jgi:hypothetical protein